MPSAYLSSAFVASSHGTVISAFPNNLAGGDSTHGPSVPTSKRKQTLLTLLAALQELNNDDELGQSVWLVLCGGGIANVGIGKFDQQPSFEDDRDVRESVPQAQTAFRS